MTIFTLSNCLLQQRGKDKDRADREKNGAGILEVLVSFMIHFHTKKHCCNTFSRPLILSLVALISPPSSDNGVSSISIIGIKIALPWYNAIGS